MDPTLAAAISMIAAALATTILRAASYYFPSGRHRPGSVSNKDEDVAEDTD